MYCCTVFYETVPALLSSIGKNMFWKLKGMIVNYHMPSQQQHTGIHFYKGKEQTSLKEW